MYFNCDFNRKIFSETGPWFFCKLFTYPYQVTEISVFAVLSHEWWLWWIVNYGYLLENNHAVKRLARILYWLISIQWILITAFINIHSVEREKNNKIYLQTRTTFTPIIPNINESWLNYVILSRPCTVLLACLNRWSK